MLCSWSITQGDPGLTIAVVDNNFVKDHLDLVSKFRTINGCSDAPVSGLSHGTATTGAAAGIVNNGYCVAGGGFNTTVDGYCWDSGILNQVWEAYRAGSPIINLSVHSRIWETNSPMVRALFQEVVFGGTVVTYVVNGTNAINFSDIDGMINVGLAWADGWFRFYPGSDLDLNVNMVVPSYDIARLELATPRSEPPTLRGWLP